MVFFKFLLLLGLISGFTQCKGDFQPEESFVFSIQSADTLVDPSQFITVTESYIQEKFEKLGFSITEMNADPKSGKILLSVPEEQGYIKLSADEYLNILSFRGGLEFRAVWNPTDEPVRGLADSMANAAGLGWYIPDPGYFQLGHWLHVPLADVDTIRSELAAFLNRMSVPSGTEPVWTRGDNVSPIMPDAKALFLLRPTDPNRKITGEMISQAVPDANPASGMPAVSVSFNEEGRRRLAELTRWAAEERRVVAIVTAGEVLTAPRVVSPIPNGQLVLSGDFTALEAMMLANLMLDKGWPIPTEVEYLPAEE